MRDEWKTKGENPTIGHHSFAVKKCVRVVKGVYSGGGLGKKNRKKGSLPEPTIRWGVHSLSGHVPATGEVRVDRGTRQKGRKSTTKSFLGEYYEKGPVVSSSPLKWAEWPWAKKKVRRSLCNFGVWPVKKAKTGPEKRHKSWT